MENESKKQVENTDSSNEKLLLSDVINLVCEFEKPEHCYLAWCGRECKECEYVQEQTWL